jgi:hypothetical protein
MTTPGRPSLDLITIGRICPLQDCVGPDDVGDVAGAVDIAASLVHGHLPPAPEGEPS